MGTPWLFPEAELPLAPKPSVPARAGWTGVVAKLSRKALNELIAKVQLNFNDLLSKPILRQQRKRRKRKPAQEDAKEFFGSITLTQRRAEEGLSHELSEWSSGHLWAAHCWVFEESIEALKAGKNSAEKRDVLEWIFSPSYIEKAARTPDGHPCLIRRHASDIPFSFVNCCRAFGISDADTFREMLVEHMSDELRPQLEKYLQITGQCSS